MQTSETKSSEAFKSRVQLIFHYPKLQKEERRRIWFKFINNLRTTTAGSHIKELEERIGDPSDNALKEREIRNKKQAVTLLAQFKDEHLRYEHSMKVMIVSDEFKQICMTGLAMMMKFLSNNGRFGRAWYVKFRAHELRFSLSPFRTLTFIAVVFVLIFRINLHRTWRLALRRREREMARPTHPWN